MDEVQTFDLVPELSGHIRKEHFPCVMAKAVEKLGGINITTSSDILNPSEISRIHGKFVEFNENFRKHGKLSSFILACRDESYASFSKFEEDFWSFLKNLRTFDLALFPHDPRVSNDPTHHEFSYSIGSEAFFILLLHPQSPRRSRQFKFPAIVFNPHIQFERLREKGIFKKIQNIIRTKDKLLQGSINPMLSDFGEKSEVFQYTGRIYAPDETVPLFH